MTDAFASVTRDLPWLRALAIRLARGDPDEADDLVQDALEVASQRAPSDLEAKSPRGWLAGGMLAWRSAAKPLTMLPQIDVRQLRENVERDRETLVVDVRQPKEWNDGHIRGEALARAAGDEPAENAA